MRHSAAPATLERQSRLGTVKRLDLALFVDRQHNGVGRWIDVEADDVPMSRSLAAKWGSLDSLNCRSRCGCRPCPRQMRCTELMLMPVVLAIADAVQCVVSPGGARSVRATTLSAISEARGGIRDGRACRAAGH